MTDTQEKIDAVHELPLRTEVKWVDMSFLFPGKVIELAKRKPGEKAAGKWAGVDLDSAELAAEVVRIHNEWLEGLTP